MVIHTNRKSRMRYGVLHQFLLLMLTFTLGYVSTRKKYSLLNTTKDSRTTTNVRVHKKSDDVTKIKKEANEPSEGYVQDGGAPTMLLLGSTGVKFSGDKIREYKKDILNNLHMSDNENEQAVQRMIFPNPITNSSTPVHHCHHWAVVTSIHSPTEAITSVLQLDSKWCLAIVGDEKTPHHDYEQLVESHDDVYYLSVEYQRNYLQQDHRKNGFISKMPFNSFARKNVGYLFAINHGAKVIFDFDDDNVLTPLEGGIATPPPFLWNDEHVNGKKYQNPWQKPSMLLRFINTKSDENESSGGQNEELGLAFNPYKYMGPSVNDSWPRGFPIDRLHSDFIMEPKELQVGDIPLTAVGVLQALCNGDPDTDAVFRMTRPQSTDFTFERTAKSLPLLVPQTSSAPYNAQATTHLSAAFWGLYLPITVPGRVTDIWRSYIAQRLMKDVGLYLVYTPPIVQHKRSAHDYLSDHVAEIDLYHKTSKLLDHLDSWSSTKEHLQERIMDLWVDLYEHDYIDEEDVDAMVDWLNTLSMIGYTFPEIPGLHGTDKASPAEVIPRIQPSLDGQPYRAFPYYNIDKDGRKFSETARQITLEEWSKNVSVLNRPDQAVVKLILMTMNEWPLLKRWVLVRGIATTADQGFFIL